MRFSFSGALISVLLMLATYGATVVHRMTIGDALTIDIPIEELPMQLGSWQGREDAPLDARSQSILQLDRSVKRLYRGPDGAEVFLYIGYWKQQTGETQAGKHSPVLCLPANGWKIGTPEPVQIQDKEGARKVTISSLDASFRGTQSIFKYWFFSGTEMYRDETEALLRTSLGMFSRTRTDGGIVEVSIPYRDSHSSDAERDRANDAAMDFVKVLYPALRDLLEKAEGRAVQQPGELS